MDGNMQFEATHLIRTYSYHARLIYLCVFLCVLCDLCG